MYHMIERWMDRLKWFKELLYNSGQIDRISRYISLVDDRWILLAMLIAVLAATWITVWYIPQIIWVNIKKHSIRYLVVSVVHSCLAVAMFFVVLFVIGKGHSFVALAGLAVLLYFCRRTWPGKSPNNKTKTS